jgi:hypothetical protein
MLEYKMENNSFLRNFMKMREGLRAGKPKPPPVGQPKGELSLETLIHDKPKPAVVQKYFEGRVKELFKDG